MRFFPLKRYNILLLFFWLWCNALRAYPVHIALHYLLIDYDLCRWYYFYFGLWCNALRAYPVHAAFYTSLRNCTPGTPAPRSFIFFGYITFDRMSSAHNVLLQIFLGLFSCYANSISYNFNYVNTFCKLF